jgi:hypothetical protein
LSFTIRNLPLESVMVAGACPSRAPSGSAMMWTLPAGSPVAEFTTVPESEHFSEGMVAAAV